MRITRKRLKKIIKNKNQSRRKYKKRKNKKRRRKKRKNTLTKYKKYNLRSKSLKKYKGGAKIILPVLMSVFDNNGEKIPNEFAFKLCDIDINNDTNIPKIVGISNSQKAESMGKSLFFDSFLNKPTKFQCNLNDKYQISKFYTYINDLFLFLHSCFTGEKHKLRQENNIDLKQNPLLKDVIDFKKLLQTLIALNCKDMKKFLDKKRQLISFFNKQYKWEKVYDFKNTPEGEIPKTKYVWLGCKDKHFCPEGQPVDLSLEKTDGQYEYSDFMIEPIVEEGTNANVKIPSKKDED